MGFLSFGKKYYREELFRLETETPSKKNLYRAKQLLKLMDDLHDEDYHEFNDQCEAEFQGYSRLQHYLQINGATPFREGLIPAKPTLHYSEEKIALPELLRKLRPAEKAAHHPFIPELIRYCDYIGYEPDTAYVFLLRDALLPYLYYAAKGRENLYPWLIGRKMAEDVAGQPYVDDAVRGILFDALEYGEATTPEAFRTYAKPRIREKMGDYPKLSEALSGLLSTVSQKKITVVESGYCGTFPMLLAALDERVQIRMFTTAPFLMQVYEGQVFSDAYEKNRQFETLQIQDELLRYAAFENGTFYVNRCTDRSVCEAAEAELSQMLKGV